LRDDSWAAIVNTAREAGVNEVSIRPALSQARFQETTRGNAINAK
jgi:hypothetical protein